jgi:hypothetical protein
MRSAHDRSAITPHREPPGFASGGDVKPLSLWIGGTVALLVVLIALVLRGDASPRTVVIAALVALVAAVAGVFLVRR